MPGEFDFIDWIRSQQRTTDLVQLAAGDDLAVLKWPSDDLLLVGCDQVLDGVHFDSKVHSPKDIGRKAMNRNLSDCAAMACLPAAAVTTVALPRGTSMEYAKELYLGLREAADPFDCAIVGGDTSTWDGKLAITVSILARSEGVQPITRGGAKVGEAIYVTGALGGSMLGRHMTFEPRIGLARMLAKLHLPTAMIDISDGLSRDLAHICEQSGVGAVVYAWAIPIHENAIEMRRDGHSPLEHALHDGEDHELLFTSTKPIGGGQADAQVTLIGQTLAEPGVWLDLDGQRTPLEPKAWEHQF